MATISFIVKSKRKRQPATLYLRFRDGRKLDVIVPTPERVFPEYWSNKTQSFKQRILFSEVFSEKDKTGMEGKLSRLKDFVVKEKQELKGGRVTREWLLSVIEKFNGKRRAGNETLSEYIERFHQEATGGSRLTYQNRKIYSYGFLKNINGFKNLFNEFQGIYTEKRLQELKEKDEIPRPRKRVNFENITIDFYKDTSKNRFLSG